MGAGLKPTPQQLEALVRLRSNEDFRKFEEVVREYQHELNERLIGFNDLGPIHRSQGGITACRDLIQIVHEAPDTLRKLSERKTP